MKAHHPRRVLTAAALVGLTALVATGCGSAPDNAGGRDSKAAEAESAADLGGMEKLVAAAEKEGKLNVYALAPDWANYGEMIAAFEKKYAIEVNNEDPGGSSQGALNAAAKRKGQERAVDALDLGTSYMQEAKKQGLLAPYKVKGWGDIPDAQKQPDASFMNNYGGYISIGCDAKAVKNCPETFKDLLKPEYRNKVALNGDPTESSSALAAVIAASLANGGSLDDAQPGLDFFQELRNRVTSFPRSPRWPPSSRARRRSRSTGTTSTWGTARSLSRRASTGRSRCPPTACTRALQPGRQQVRPAPGGRPAVAGVRLQPGGPEHLAQGLLPSGAPGGDEEGRQRRQGRRRPDPRGPRHSPEPTGEQEAKAKETVVQGWGKAVS
ncbi:ABC transporter substrate-binding protein [Streptomyces badius]